MRVRCDIQLHWSNAGSSGQWLWSSTLAGLPRSVRVVRVLSASLLTSGGGWLRIHSGLSLRKILLCIPTCLADLVPTTSAMATFDEGPNLCNASTNSACSAGVHCLVLEAAATGRSWLASAACWFLMCWPRDLSDGSISLQYGHLIPCPSQGRHGWSPRA